MEGQASKNKRALQLVASCLCVALSGCGTLKAYPGPRSEANSVALLKPALALSSHVVLEEVNGESVRFWQDRAEVKPGLQRVQALAVLTQAYRTVMRRHVLEFEAAAGHEYTLSADWYLYGPRIRVFDREGKLVAEALAPPPPLRVLRTETVGAGEQLDRMDDLDGQARPTHPSGQLQ